MRLLLVFAASALFAAAAQAQLRTIPADAKRGEMRHLAEMSVELDGKRATLAPGAQIRDTENRIVLPGFVTQTVVVKYLLDDSGMVRRVWILTPQEDAQR